MSTVVAISYAVLWFVVVLLAILVALMARQIGILYGRIPPVGAMSPSDKPAVGDASPVHLLTDLHGSALTVGSPARDLQLLIFMSPGCSTCRDLAPAVRTVVRGESDRVETVVVVGSLERDSARTFVRTFALGGLSIVAEPTLAKEFGVVVTPFAVAVDRAGVIRGKGLVNNLEQLEGLLESARLDPRLLAMAGHPNSNGAPEDAKELHPVSQPGHER